MGLYPNFFTENSSEWAQVRALAKHNKLHIHEIDMELVDPNVMPMTHKKASNPTGKPREYSSWRTAATKMLAIRAFAQGSKSYVSRIGGSRRRLLKAEDIARCEGL